MPKVPSTRRLPALVTQLQAEALLLQLLLPVLLCPQGLLPVLTLPTPGLQPPAPGGAPSPPLAPGGASGDVSASATNNVSFVGTPLHHRCHLRLSLNMCHCNQAGYLTTCEDYPVWRAPVFWRTAQARCVHGCQLYSLRSSKLVLSYIVVLPVRRQPCFPT